MTAAISRIEELARTCLDHLQIEREQLRMAHEALDRMKQAMLRADTPELEAAAAEDASVRAMWRQLHERRAALRIEIARQIGCPDAVADFRAVEDRLAGKAREDLRQRRHEVATLASHIEALTFEIVALTRNALEVWRQVLHSLTGEDAPAGSYTRQGREAIRVCSGILRTRC